MSETEQLQESDEDELADRLYDYERATVSDDAVKAEVSEIGDTEEGDIEVVAELPTGDTVSRTFPQPLPWTDSNPFVRLVEAHDYDGASYACLEGDEITLQQANNGWEIKIPEPDRGIIERMRHDDRFRDDISIMFRFAIGVGYPAIASCLAVMVGHGLLLLFTLMLTWIGFMSVAINALERA